MKKTRLMKLASCLLALAPTVAYATSAFWFVGEPKLPKKLEK